eukprot:scaffold836_cov123-Isochrysis_galbana.AAC.15
MHSARPMHEHSVYGLRVRGRCERAPRPVGSSRMPTTLANRPSLPPALPHMWPLRPPCLPARILLIRRDDELRARRHGSLQELEGLPAGHGRRGQVYRDGRLVDARV